MSINQITLQTMKPTVIKKLQNLARSHQRTLEEEITVILEDAVLVDRGVDLGNQVNTNPPLSAIMHRLVR